LTYNILRAFGFDTIAMSLIVGTAASGKKMFGEKSKHDYYKRLLVAVADLPTNFEFGFPAISNNLPADWRDELWRSAENQNYKESKHLQHEVSFDSLIGTENGFPDDSIVNPIEEAICLIDAAELTREIKLSPLEEEVLRLQYEGYSIDEIADKCKKSKSTINAALKNGKRKIRKYA
jgi:predicted DNA-binding protein (UPF0251 family)